MPWQSPDTDQEVGNIPERGNSGWQSPETDQEVPSGKSLSGLASNAAKDAGEMVSGVANLAGNMIAHPIDTSSQVVKGIPAAIKQWAQEIGVPEALHGQFADALSKFGNSAYEHPVSRALDVASLAVPALKGLGVAGEGAEVAELAGKAGKMGAVGETLTDASNALGRRELGFTKRLLNTGDKLDKANDTTQWAIKNGLMETLDDPATRLDKANTLKEGAWNRMADTYSNPALAGKNLNAQRLVDALETTRPRDAAGNILRGGDYDAINNEIDKKIEDINAFGKKGVTPPVVSDTLTDAAGRPMVMSPGGKPVQLTSEIPWADAQNLKNVMKASTKWDLTQPTSINDLRKRLSGSFRGEMDKQLEDAIGQEGMADYNAAKGDYGHAKNVIRALENKVSSKTGNRALGLTDTIAGAGALGAHAGPIGVLAVVAGKKLIERYGLAAGSKALASLAGGKYAGVLGHLTTFGPAEMATINMIAENDPQFAKELTTTVGQ